MSASLNSTALIPNKDDTESETYSSQPLQVHKFIRVDCQGRMANINYYFSVNRSFFMSERVENQSYNLKKGNNNYRNYCNYTTRT